MAADVKPTKISRGVYRLGNLEIVRTGWRMWTVQKERGPGARDWAELDNFRTKREALTAIREGKM